MIDHPVFGFQVPIECPGVDDQWMQIPTGEHVHTLADKFIQNMDKFSGQLHPDVVRLGGPTKRTHPIPLPVVRLREEKQCSENY